MNAVSPSRPLHARWRRMSLLFLSLLPVLALFHLAMWLAYTRTLFRPETGDLKRIGYLVGFEDCKARLVAQEPKSGYTLLAHRELANAKDVSVVLFGDSFAPSLAKAYALKTQQPVGVGAVNWEQGNGLAQIESWLRNDWFRRHGVRTIILERVEYAWLDTFANKGESTLPLPWASEESAPAPIVPQKSGGSARAPSPVVAPTTYQKAIPWTFANNGNFKVVLCNLAYLVSPTALKMTDTCVVPLKQKFFDCSYGDKLLFYRGDLRGALKPDDGRLEPALKHLQELNAICQKQGIQLRIIVPPVKSYLYYDWVKQPFYPNSPLLETLQSRATPYGYVDLKQRFHHELAAGYQDLYYPDDAHWNFPAAEIAAEELAKP